MNYSPHFPLCGSRDHPHVVTNSFNPNYHHRDGSLEKDVGVAAMPAFMYPTVRTIEMLSQCHTDFCDPLIQNLPWSNHTGSIKHYQQPLYRFDDLNTNQRIGNVLDGALVVACQQQCNNETMQQQQQQQHIKNRRGSDNSSKSGGFTPPRRRRATVEPFPEKLYTILQQAEIEGFQDIVSWQPHGRSFILHQPKRFAAEIMPRFFVHDEQPKYRSFQRQLNLYGFSRFTTGPDKGGFYHDLFRRGHLHLCNLMARTRAKGVGAIKHFSSPSSEPNFYNMQDFAVVAEKKEEEYNGDSQVVQVLPALAANNYCSPTKTPRIQTFLSLEDDTSVVKNQHHQNNFLHDGLSKINVNHTISNEILLMMAPKSPHSIACQWEDACVNLPFNENDSQVLPTRCIVPFIDSWKSVDFEGEPFFDENDLLLEPHEEMFFEGKRFFGVDEDPWERLGVEHFVDNLTRTATTTIAAPTALH